VLWKIIYRKITELNVDLTFNESVSFKKINFHIRHQRIRSITWIVLTNVCQSLACTRINVRAIDLKLRILPAHTFQERNVTHIDLDCLLYTRAAVFLVTKSIRERAIHINR